MVACRACDVVEKALEHPDRSGHQTAYQSAHPHEAECIFSCTPNV
jgi:hypothetical protein